MAYDEGPGWCATTSASWPRLDSFVGLTSTSVGDSFAALRQCLK
jgi:hypothetical protein